MKQIFCMCVLAILGCSSISAQDIATLQKQLKYIKDDTSGARLPNDLSTAFYNNNENDSCKKYAVMALQLTDKLLNTDAAKRNTAYAMQCKKLKAQAIENIGSSLYYEDINKGTDTLRAALKLWNETGDKKGIASAYSRIGELCSIRSDYVNALKYCDTSLNLYRQANDENNMGYEYYQIALNQRYMGNYGDALESNIKALAIGRKVKDTSLITLSLLANGFVYMYVKNITEALKNQQAALSIFLASHDSVGIATVYNDMGVTNARAGNSDAALKDHSTALMIRKQINDYTGVGNSCSYISQILQQQGKYEQALAYSIEALKYAKLSGYVSYVLDSYNDAGNIYLEMHDDENALKNYDTVLQISTKINDRKNQAEALESISEIYLSQGNPNEAIIWLQKAVAITDAYDFRNLRIIYKNLSSAYAKTGDYKNAYESSIKFKQFNDSVASSEKTEKIAGITNQLAFENKQALQKASQDKQLAVQQSEIERQKLVRNIIISGLVIVVVFAVIFFIRFREKRKLNIALEKTVTNLKATQTQLIHSEKMASLGELTAGIAHEIQNPLNFVNNFSDVNKEMLEELKAERLKPKAERDETMQDDTINHLIENEEKINHHGKRADSIVKGMLQHSRAGTGKKEPTDINKLADEYLRLSYYGMRAKDKSFNAEFKTDFDERIGKINAVPQDIGRVLLNLFNNAFYAVGERRKAEGIGYEPTVSITTKRINSPLGDRGIEIKVADNGNGVPQNIVDKIFQPFFTTKPTGKGTGLGLSLSYDIIKAHGGEIKVESKEREGSEFVMVLPA